MKYYTKRLLHTTQLAVARLCDWYCDVTNPRCAIDSYLYDWLWTSIAHLLWQKETCACASPGAQRSARVLCGVCSHDCS